MPEDLSSLIKSCVKRSGGAITISQLSDVDTPYHLRMPFGIADLDAALKGGLPCGTVNQIFAPDGVGKNMLAYMLMAECQRIHGDASNIMFLSFGYKPDVDFVRKCGVKVYRTDYELKALGVDPSHITAEDLGEQVGNVYFTDAAAVEDDEDDPKKKKKKKKDPLASTEEEEAPAEAVLTAASDMIASGKFQLIIIDEMASGETKDDVAKTLKENSRMATWANLVTQFIKKVYTGLRKRTEDGSANATCIVVLQPVRANMDANTAKFVPHSIPSGYALKHAKAIDLHLKNGGAVTRGGKKVGKIVKWKISKGKFGLGEGAEGEFEFIHYDEAGNGGVDKITLLANTAMAHGVITRKGAFYYILNYEDRVEGGMERVTEILRGSPELVEEVRAALLSAAVDGEVPE